MADLGAEWEERGPKDSGDSGIAPVRRIFTAAIKAGLVCTHS